jgi:hypothetical protein
MELIFLTILGTGYLIYKIAFIIPRDIRSVENKVDMVKFHLQEIELRLNEISKKLDNK